MCDDCFCEAVAGGGADERYCFCYDGWVEWGCGRAVYDGDFGAGCWGLGVASDVYWVFCCHAGVLGGFAEGEEEGGVMRLAYIVFAGEG